MRLSPLGLLVLLGPVRAGAVDWTFADCPLVVVEECRDYCGSRAGPESCRWREFGCDFRICWGTRHHTSIVETQRALMTPATYRLSGLPEGGPANLVSMVRLSGSSSPALYLVRGEFVAEIPQLFGAEEARRFIQYAQACALSATRAPTTPEEERVSRFVERSASTDNVYWVGCSRTTGRAGFQRLEATPEQILGPPARASSGGGGGARGGGGGGGAPLQPMQPLSPEEAERARTEERRREISEMPDEELRSLLQWNRSIAVDGNGRISVHVDGQWVLPFSSRTAPEARERAFEEITQDQLYMMKELYTRTRQRVIEEAESRRPAREGEYYDYDDYSGRAVIREAEDKE